jgi:hypothetical protein
MLKHYVDFYQSTGMPQPERTRKPIPRWDTELAMEMARELAGDDLKSFPYGFRFLTKKLSKGNLKGKVTESSGMYYIGGRIVTHEEISTRDDPKDVLLSKNMRLMGVSKIVEVDNAGGRVRVPHDERDQMIQFAGEQSNG